MAATTAVSLYACLPDLESPTPAVPPPVVVRPVTCGDGLIDPAAGEECDPSDAGDAGVRGCTRDCVAECEGKVLDPAGGHCYFTLPGVADFATATQACASRAAHLVTFASADEVAAVATGLRKPEGDAGARTYWVGLHLISNGVPGLARYANVTGEEPGFSAPSQCPGCYGDLGEATAFPKLDAGPEAGAYDCLVAGTHAVPTDPWYRLPCTARANVVCEREPVGTRAYPCNGGTCVQLARTIGSRRYLFVPIASTAAEAARSCAQLPGGNLVVYRSNEEREELFRELGRARVLEAFHEFWIGLAFDAAAGIWKWGDGVSAENRVPWAEGEPKNALPVRAYSARATGSYDTELARSLGGDGQLPYLCEYAAIIPSP